MRCTGLHIKKRAVKMLNSKGIRFNPKGSLFAFVEIWNIRCVLMC